TGSRVSAKKSPHASRVSRPPSKNSNVSARNITPPRLAMPGADLPAPHSGRSIQVHPQKARSSAPGFFVTNGASGDADNTARRNRHKDLGRNNRPAARNMRNSDDRNSGDRNNRSPVRNNKDHRRRRRRPRRLRSRRLQDRTP